MTNPLNDKDGKTGFLRVAVMTILIAWLSMWLYSGINQVPMPEIEMTDIMLILGALGYKTVQTVKGNTQ